MLVGDFVPTGAVAAQVDTPDLGRLMTTIKWYSNF